jgi:hypothetical protein
MDFTVFIRVIALKLRIQPFRIKRLAKNCALRKNAEKPQQAKLKPMHANPIILAIAMRRLR